MTTRLVGRRAFIGAVGGAATVALVSGSLADHRRAAADPRPSGQVRKGVPPGAPTRAEPARAGAVTRPPGAVPSGGWAAPRRAAADPGPSGQVRKVVPPGASTSA